MYKIRIFLVQNSYINLFQIAILQKYIQRSGVMKTLRVVQSSSILSLQLSPAKSNPITLQIMEQYYPPDGRDCFLSIHLFLIKLFNKKQIDFDKLKIRYFPCK